MHTSQGSGAAGHTAGKGRLHLGPSASGPEVQAFAVHGAPRGSCMRGGWEGSWLSPALTWTSGGQRGAGGGLAVSCSASLIGHPTVSGSTSLSVSPPAGERFVAGAVPASLGSERALPAGPRAGEDCRAPCSAQSGPERALTWTVFSDLTLTATLWGRQYSPLTDEEAGAQRG